jgi:DNA adenine methylase
MSANALPFLRWAGGKRWLAERVAERIQPRLESATYIEPFLGGGAMYFALAPKQRAILSDNNAELIETYQTLRASYALVAKELERLPVSAEDYYRIRDNERPRSRVGRAARFIYLNRTCYGGIHRTNQEGVFNVPYGGGDRNAKKILESGILETAARILRETRQLDLVARDFEFSISQARDGDVIYADPCYRGSARIGYDRYGPKAYSFEDQKRLAKCLLFAFEKNALILLSTQATEGFEELVARGFVLTLWRRPGLTHPGKQQTGKELLIVLDPKHDLARWEPLSDFNVKLNGKHRADPEPVRPRFVGEIVRRVTSEAAKHPLAGRISNRERGSKWDLTLLQLLERSPDGVTGAEIQRAIGIHRRSLMDRLYYWRNAKRISQDTVTKKWRVVVSVPFTYTSQSNCATRKRARENGVSPGTQNRLDQVAPFRPDLLERIKDGQLSVHAAYRLLKASKSTSLMLGELRRAWRRATERERAIFRAEIDLQHYSHPLSP